MHRQNFVNSVPSGAQRAHIVHCNHRVRKVGHARISSIAQNALTALRAGYTRNAAKCIAIISFVLLPALPVASVQAENIARKPIWLQQTMSLADARHLAGRTGFGASPEELAALTQLSRSDAVHAIVEGLNTLPHVRMPSWVEEPAPHFWTRRYLSRPKQQAFDQARDREIVELRRWWVNNMLQTTSPQTERLVLFWHDHFATSYKGVNRRSVSIARQNQMFRSLGSGSYRGLLKAIIRDPAMLLYLDNQSNRKGRPNENFARELLELFTLGEGNFDEATVKEAARALTGYGVSDTKNHSFKLHGYKRDLEEKILFGNTGNHDGDVLVDLILEQSFAAEHLVKKFWHAFVSDNVPDADFVQTLSLEFRASDYNIAQLYKSVISSAAFWHEDNRLSLIKSPATLLIGTARSLDYPKQAWTRLPSLHALLGMNLFSPPNVGGWDEGAAYVVPGRLLNRQLALKSLLSVSNKPVVRNTPGASSDNMMMVSKSATMEMSSLKTDVMHAPLRVRLAGHFFQGAPKYKVAIHDSDNKPLWTSEERTLEISYDTEMFGEMRDFDQLVWQTSGYNPPEGALSAGVRVVVEFLNDAADKTGDRNLFVESAQIGTKTFTAVGGLQVSHCAPKNPRDAGRLYCAGTVSISVTDNGDGHIPRSADYTASSASVLWSNRNKQKLNAIIALENVQTPDGYFHTVSFLVVSKNAEELELRLDSFGCWPDCIKQWPECAWLDGRSQEKTIVFPLRRGRNQNIDCHYTSILAAEQSLVNALYASLPMLFQHLSSKFVNKEQVPVIKRWQDRLTVFEKRLGSSVYLADTKPFELNAQFVMPNVQQYHLPEPFVAIDNLDAFEQLVKGTDLSLSELLIGGASISHFPELADDATMPFEQQLESLITHPVYQIY